VSEFKFLDIMPGQRPTGLMEHFGLVPAREQPAAQDAATDAFAGLSNEDRAFLQADPKLAAEYAKRLEEARSKVEFERTRETNLAEARQSWAALDRAKALAERVARGDSK
jgi:hypothetical protein